MALRINTIVALDIHATASLDEEHSGYWLSGINDLKLDELNGSLYALSINDPSRRNNIESAAADIVCYFLEGLPITQTFVMDPADLIKIPGLSQDCLELTNLQLGIKLTKDAIEKTINKITQKTALESSSSSSTNKAKSSQPRTIETSLKPKDSSWAEVVKRKKVKTVSGVTPNLAFKTAQPTTQRFCLKVTAPANTTTANITSFTQTWKAPLISSLKVEIVTNLPSHSPFRLYLLVLKTNLHFWKYPKLWPEITKVKLWYGDTDQPIPNESTREKSHKIFIA